MQALENDIDDEHAWARLYEVVDSDEDRLICLENLVLLDPDNEDARKKLAALQIETGDTAQDGYLITEELTPLSPAAAILYPERLIKRWQWRDDITLNQISDIDTQANSRYSDVWEEENELCAFCAAPLSEEAKRCPQCRRKISYTEYSFKKTSSKFTLFWVLVLATAQLFFIQSLIDIIQKEPIEVAIWHGLLFSVYCGLVLLIVMRHPTGYVGSILLLIITLVLMIIGTASRSDAELAAGDLSGENLLTFLAESSFTTWLNPVLDLIRPFQMITMSLALVFGILFVGPDFERTRVRFSARVDKGLQDPSEYYASGRRYSEKGMWATAVLHFQRAVGKEPNRPSYLRSLGEAYGRLGFFERALDVLESARNISADDSQKAKISAEIAAIQDARILGLAEEQKHS